MEWRKNFKKNGQGRRTELLTEEGRTQVPENHSILNGYVLKDDALEKYANIPSLRQCVCFATVLPALRIIIKNKNLG